MTLEQLLKRYKKKYPKVPYEKDTIDDWVFYSKKNDKLHSYGDAPSYVLLKNISFF